MSNDYSSSSDDEYNPGSQNRFHIQIPQQQLNLNEVRKQNQKKEKSKFTKQTSSNFNKVASKFQNKKSDTKKYPDSYTPRDPRASLNASRLSYASFEDDAGGDGDSDSNDDDDDDDEFNPGGSSSSKQNLPHFKFDADDIRKSQGPIESDDDSDSDDGSYQDQTHIDFTHIQQAPHEQFYHTDSSDEEHEITKRNHGRPESYHQDPLERTSQDHQENHQTNTLPQTQHRHLPTLLDNLVNHRFIQCVHMKLIKVLLKRACKVDQKSPQVVFEAYFVKCH